MHFSVHRMLLHAWKLKFRHPSDDSELECVAPLDETWQRVIERFGWHHAIA
jgi:tRNA pseudouridine65 synthase